MTSRPRTMPQPGRYIAPPKQLLPKSAGLVYLSSLTSPGQAIGGRHPRPGRPHRRRNPGAANSGLGILLQNAAVKRAKDHWVIAQHPTRGHHLKGFPGGKSDPPTGRTNLAGQLFARRR